MAGLNMNNSGMGKRKGKPTKMNLRVDFTPMVDMNMLLITFFMFCTTLSIPQVMDIVVPTKEVVENGNETAASKTVTVLLGEEDKIYYYEGKPDYEDYTSLKVTDYTSSGLREVLLNRNSEQVSKVIELKRKKKSKEISEKEFRVQMTSLKKSDNSIVVLIKPMDASSYKNLVDALDEMQVCSVSKYAIMNLDEADEFLFENYKMKGTLTASM